MKRKMVFMLAAGLIAVAFTSAIAQPDSPAGEAPKETVRVSGLMYLQWMKEVERPSGAENRNGFDVQRVYLNFAYKIDDVWSTRATLDVGNDNGKDERYQAFLKYGYVQAATELGFGRLTSRFGLIGTPVIGFIDGQSDYRWLNQNFVNASNLVLHNQEEANMGHLSMRVPDDIKGQSLDTPADLGAGVNLSMRNLVAFDLQVTNGEGFKRTNDFTGSSNDDGKAYLAMVTVTPLPGLAVAGYYRYCTTNDAEGADNYVNYYGGSAVYQFQGIRAGISVVLAEVSTMALGGTQATVAQYRLIDAFVMANMKALAGLPVLLAGRYVIGATKYDDGYAANGLEANATVWAAGIGWQFNDRVRAMAYFENQESSSDDIPAAEWNNPARNFWIKTEVTF